MTVEEQAVVESEGVESQTAAPEDDAQEERLEDILKQFEDEPEEQSKPAQKEPGVSKEDLAEVVAFTRQAQADRTRADIDAAVDTIHTSLDEGVAISKNAIRRMLNGAAGEDERIQRAWMNRATNPGLYTKLLTTLAREWSEEFRPIDKAATETREAVSNAVRGASKPTAPEPEDYSKVPFMNDSQFEQWKRDQAKKMKKA